MGKITFLLPEDWAFERRTATTIHVVGLDGVPWPCKITKDEPLLEISRNRDESGHVFVSYPFQEFGELVISTGTLPESDVPVRLLKELARGVANRLRNQLSIWQEGGLEISPDVMQWLDESVTWLGHAVAARDPRESDRAARQSLEFAMRANFRLGRQFAEQVFPMRLEQINCPKHWIGCQVLPEHVEQHADDLSFADILQLPLNCEVPETLSNAILGPFLDASAGGMPAEWEELSDFEERQVATLKSCRTALSHLPESVKLLHVASGLNGMGHRYLNYPQQLQLTVDLLEAVENSAQSVPTMVSLDCPWGERLAWSVGGIHPLQIADSILRRGVSLSMLGLDINLDYWPNGSLPRDPLQWMDLIDLWSQLGLPLVVRLAAPSVVSTLVASTSPDRTINSIRESVTDPQLLELLRTVIPMMLARPVVQGVIWTQFQDGMDRRYPKAGFIDEAGQAKPVLDVFRNL